MAEAYERFKSGREGVEDGAEGKVRERGEGQLTLSAPASVHTKHVGKINKVRWLRGEVTADAAPKQARLVVGRRVDRRGRYIDNGELRYGCRAIISVVDQVWSR